VTELANRWVVHGTAGPRREHLPGLQAAAFLDDRTGVDPKDRRLPAAF
jgi:hypothetical protein